MEQLDFNSKLSHGEEMNKLLVIRNEVIRLRKEHEPILIINNNNRIELYASHVIIGMTYYQIIVNESEEKITYRAENKEGQYTLTFQEFMIK